MKASRNMVILAAMGLSAALFAQVGVPTQTYRFTAGQIGLHLPTDPSQFNGLVAAKIQSTASGFLDFDTNSGFGFNLGRTNLLVVGSDYRLDRFTPGQLQVNGGFTLSVGRRTIDFSNFVLRPTAESPRSRLELVGIDRASGKEFTLDVLRHLGVFQPESNRLRLAGADLRVSLGMAKFFGNENLTNYTIGSFTLDGTIQMISGPELPPMPSDPPTNPRALYDVGICNISGFSQQGRIGTFPTGTLALSCSTTSTNYAATTVPWFAATTSMLQPMNANHPVIAQNLYRIEGGKFEQIGEGWVKHGFLATNSTECYTGGWANLPGVFPGGGGCVGPSGAGLKPGCNDTYGASLNANRTYMGPKNEVNPYTGLWNPVGSYFAMGQPDNLRRRTGTQRINLTTGATESWTPGAIENRMPVEETDLDRPAGTEFYYEAYYVSQNEIDKYNQILHRKTNVTKVTSSSSWTFTDTSTYALGPAINSWAGATKVTALPRLDGDAIVALKTTSLGSGWYLYDYAVYVHDIDREIKAFYIPVDASVAVQNITFRDTDKITTNQWNMVRSNGAVRWTMQATPNSNTLSWGRTFNFRFEAQAAPVASFAQGELFKAGSFPYVTAPINGPTPSSAAVTGTLTIPGRGADAPTTVALRLTPLDGGATTVLSNVAVNMPAGTFSAPTTLRGRFNVAVQGAPFLRKAFPTVVNIGPDGGNIPVNVTLIAGDVDGSGEIDAVDIDAVIAAFGQTGGGVADVDGSAEVDAVDIDVVISRFGLTGDL